MLPLKNLDDLLFADMVENAKKMIPSLTDEWINTTSSDPGITFIELFAWLLEMQQYYLNSISLKNKYKYLKLFGEKVQHDKPSSAIVTLKNAKEEYRLPSKCKFAAGNIIFETERVERIFPIKITGFFSTEDNIVVNTSEKNWKEQYYIFGRNIKVQNDFYICFNAPFPINTYIDIVFNIFNDYTVKRNAINNEESFIHLAEIEWQYYTKKGWRKIDFVKDATLEFIKSGKITFNLKSSMEINMETDSYMIRGVLKEASYDVPPVFKQVQINSIKLTQKDTLAETSQYEISKEKPEIEILSYLGLYGHIDIFIKGENELLERVYDYEVTDKQNKKIINLNNIFKDEKEKTKLTVLLCAYDNNFYLNKSIGHTDGFPDFFIPLIFEDIFYEDFEIWISKDFNKNIYEKWSKCGDLYIQGCNDKKYYLDLDNKKLTFGDGINGKIPEGEIIITGFSTTKTNRANVKAREINKLLIEKYKGVSVTNNDPSFGGRRAPSIDDYFKKVRKKLKKVTRAVTDEDYEYIVKSTPGLMIKNAKVIISNEQNNIFNNDNPNTVYIVVESYKRSFQHTEKLSTAYIQNIKNNLEKYRLITTEIEVISPEYIYIDIEGEIRIHNYFKEAEKIITDVIMDYFNNQKWDFGRSIIYSDLYGIIDMIQCVKRIYSLTINFSGRGAKKNDTSDIDIPLNGIIVLRNCVINVSDD